MPHVLVTLAPGKSEAQKKELGAKIVKDVTETLGYGDEAVSVAMEEVPLSQWTDKVYMPEIKAKWGTLYKEPGYEPF